MERESQNQDVQESKSQKLRGTDRQTGGEAEDQAGAAGRGGETEPGEREPEAGDQREANRKQDTHTNGRGVEFGRQRQMKRTEQVQPLA